MKSMFVIVVALLALNLASYLQVRSLEERNGQLAEEIGRVRAVAGGAGPVNGAQWIPDFEALVGPQGLELLVFQTQCPACELGAPSWNALAQERRAVGYGFAGLATDEEGLDEFLGRHAFDFPVLRAGPDTFRDLGVLATPETVVLNAKGDVIAQGVLADALRAKRTSFAETLGVWPAAVRTALWEALGAAYLDGVERSVSIVLEEGLEVVVYEGQANIRGYGALLESEVVSSVSSDLDVWVIHDAAGGLRAVLPLRQHRAGDQPVTLAELEGWARGRTLVPEEGGPLARALVRELRRLRVALGFSAIPPAH